MILYLSPVSNMYMKCFLIEKTGTTSDYNSGIWIVYPRTCTYVHIAICFPLSFVLYLIFINLPEVPFAMP